MTKEQIIDSIARLNSETWRDREEVRTEIGKLLAELEKSLEQQPSDDCVSRRFMEELGGTCIAKRNEKGVLVPIIGLHLLPSVVPGDKIHDIIKD